MPESWREGRGDEVKEPMALRKYRSKNGWERKKKIKRKRKGRRKWME